MNTNNFNFKEKIDYIYKKIAKEDMRTLAKLFLGKEKTSIENRVLHLRNIWLKKENFVPRLFKKEFNNYAISQLKIEDSPIFIDAQSFLNMNLDEFYKKIDFYIYKKQDFDFEKEIGYKYLYIFSQKADKENYFLDYYQIEFNDTKSINIIEINVYPPQYNKKTSIYKGKLTIDKNKLLLNIKNEYDHIQALFNRELQNSQLDYLVGVAIGISDFNQKTPIAKKVVLSKEKIEGLAELYLILNETEVVSATENIQYLSNIVNIKKEDIQFKKLSNKVNSINKFLQQSSKKYYKSFYHQLAFKEFIYINEIFQKVSNNKAYYNTFRETMLTALLESYEYEKYDSLYIVMPIYTKYGLFNHHSETIDFIKNKFLELSKKIKLKFIFTLKEYDYDLTHIKPYLDELSKNAKIYFVLNKNIENLVNSRDFIFSKNKDFVIIQELRSLKAAHKLYLSKLSHQEYENYYRKIKAYSIEYKNFIKEPKLIKFDKIDDITKKLLGKWNIYFFGINQKISKLNIVFKNDKSVEIYKNNALKSIGFMIHKNVQTIIILDNLITKRSIIISFDNNIHLINEAFIINILSKEFYFDYDAYIIGICSKKTIKYEDLNNILLNKPQTRCINSKEVRERLSKYLVSNIGY